MPAATTLEDCQKLVDTVKKTGQIYMMAETSCFHAATMSAREWRKQGKFGKIYYTEGCYLHDHGSFLKHGTASKELMAMFIQDGKPGGFLLIAAEEKELSVVYVVGSIDLASLQEVVKSTIQYDLKSAGGQ